MKRLFIISITLLIAANSWGVNITFRIDETNSNASNYNSQIQYNNIFKTYLFQAHDSITTCNNNNYKTNASLNAITPRDNQIIVNDPLFKDQAYNSKYVRNRENLPAMFHCADVAKDHGIDMMGQSNLYTDMDQASFGTIHSKGLDFPAEPGEDVPLSSGNGILFLSLLIYTTKYRIRLKKQNNESDNTLIKKT